MRWRIASFLLLSVLAPTVVPAAEPAGIGVVSTLNGQAAVIRGNSPQPLPLHFKDQLYARDRITTNEQSLAQILLGGKALLTAGELSEVALVKEVNRSVTVDVQKGKISLAVLPVADPGIIGVRTPNASIVMRHAVMVIDAVSIGQPKFVTDISVTSGQAEIYDAAGKRQATLRAGMSLTVIGSSGAGESAFRASFPPPSRVFEGLHGIPQHIAMPEEAARALASRQLAAAQALAQTMIKDKRQPPAKDIPFTDWLMATDIARGVVTTTTGQNVAGNESGGGASAGSPAPAPIPTVRISPGPVRGGRDR